MAESTYPTMTGAVGVSDVGVFIPELWSDEVLASYKQNLVLADLVTRMDHKGRKGDTIHIPAPYRGGTNKKVENTAVTIQNATEEEVTISIDQHWEYSRIIEDFASVQALGSLRQHYTADAGYQMSRTIDQFIAAHWHFFNAGAATPAAATAWETGVIGSDGSTTFDHTANTNTGNGAALADAGIREVIQTLDDNDVPMNGRVLVIPPVERKNLMGIARFTEQAFVGEAGAGNTIRNGMIGDVYGIPVYVSTAVPWIHVNDQTGTATTTFTSTSPTGATNEDDIFGGANQFGFADFTVDWNTSSPNDTKYRACAMFHKSALAFVEQLGVRAQSQYKQEYLGTLMTVDCVFGGKGLRTGASSSGETDTAGISIIVPA